MAFSVMADVPNPLFDSNGNPFSGAVLKAFLPGTTTNTSIAIDSAGSSPQSTITYNAAGKLEVTGNEILPYIDRKHKWGIFANAADATANTPFYMGPFDNVEQTADIAQVSQSFDTVALMVASTTLSAGDIVETSGYLAKGDGGDNRYEVVGSGSGTLDGGQFIDLPNTTPATQAKGLFPLAIHVIEQWGVTADGAANDVVKLQFALDSGLKLTANGNYSIESQLVIPADLDISGNWTITLTGAFSANAAMQGDDVGDVKIDGLSFVSNGFSSTAAIIKFTHDGTTSLKGPELTNLSFNSITSRAGIDIDGNVVAADWIGSTEPDSSWLTYDDVLVAGIFSKDCILPDTSAGVGFIGVSGCRTPVISDIKILGYNQRGISTGFLLDSRIEHCTIETTDNGNGNTNCHCVYQRTSKRFLINQIEGRVDGAGGIVRLSRGAYFGAVSNVVGECSNGGSGIFYLGANNVVTTNCEIASDDEALFIGPHAPVVVNVLDNSLADSNNNSFDNCRFRSTSATEPALLYFARGIDGAQSPQPQVLDNRISNCTFLNNTNNCIMAEIETGDIAFVGCKWIANQPSIGVHVIRDSRVPDSYVETNFQGCEFVSSTSDAGGLNGVFGRAAILFAANSTSTTHKVKESTFTGWTTGVANEIAADVRINDNEFFENLSCLRINTVAVTSIHFTGNDCNTTLTSAAVQLYIDNSGSSEWSYVSHNTGSLGPSNFIRFVSTPNWDNLFLSHNVIRTTTFAFRDLPDDVTIRLTHNLVTEGVVSTIPALVDDQFNAF